VCGRTITWRKKWERTWDQVRYCSDTCRRRKLNATDVLLENTILLLLRARVAKMGGATTICPSQAAQAAIPPGSPEAWETLMEATRGAARRLVERGEIEVMQAGHVVDASRAKGPIRLRLVRR